MIFINNIFYVCCLGSLYQHMFYVQYLAYGFYIFLRSSNCQCAQTSISVCVRGRLYVFEETYLQEKEGIKKVNIKNKK